MAEYLEEQVGAGLVNGQITQLIDDQDGGLEEALEFSLEAAHGLGRGQDVEDVHGGGQQDGMAGQTGGVPQGDGQVRTGGVSAGVASRRRFDTLNASTRETTMITKLKLTNFKNFKQAEIAFGPVSVLVGANATGKSNVRDALRFLHGIARGYNLAEIIGEKYAGSGEPVWSGIRGGTRECSFHGAAAFAAEIEIVLTPTDKHSPRWFTYSIEIANGGNGGPPRVLRESLYGQTGGPAVRLPGEEPRVRWSGKWLVFDSHPADSSPEQVDPRHLALRLERGGRFKKIGPTLTALSGQPAITQVLQLAEQQKCDGLMRATVPSVLQELEALRFIDFSPDLMRKPSIPGQLILSDRGDNLSSVLQAIGEKPELKRALSNWVQELTPMDVVDFEFVPDAAGRILVYLVEQGQRKTSANSASDGTLRFLGMLAALLGPKPARFYFLEELDNGIHPARLALLMDLLDNQSRIKGIQIAASTHSPQVLRLIKPENLKYATLAYRLRGSPEGRLKPLSDIPHLMEVLKNKDIARLHESSWMENTMEFSEGTPSTFPLEGQEGGQ